MVAAIETEALTKRYDAERGIEDVALEVASGEIFGFLGPNGAGKTTAIRVLLDFHRPTSGRARVCGLDCQRDSVAVRRRVGYVAGELALYPDMTAGELVGWVARLRRGVRPGAIDDLVARFDVPMDRRVRDLSKGSKQKVGLVLALMAEAEVLILDEPTGGLDPLAQETFATVAREAAAEGRTVFLSSHSLDEVQHLADRVGIIREGRLVAVEAVATLRDRAVRSVEVRCDAPIDAGSLSRVPGVGDLHVDGARARLRISGDADALVKALAQYHVVDIVSQPADLEEIFLTYYRGGDEAGNRG